MSEPVKESKSGKTNQGFENIPKFLKILYQLLEDKSHQDHISWSHDGRALAIKNPTDFAEKLLPTYFKHSNYASFVRQLNLYSFRKKKHYPYDNTFAHTMFLKGRKDLLKFIKRKNSHVNQSEKSPKFEACLNGDSEFNELIDKNTCLKKVHQEMTEKVEALEQALKSLSDKNMNLRQYCMRKKENEEFLKKVVDKIARVYGVGPIRELIDSLALNGTRHSLNLKPLTGNELEIERAESTHCNCPFEQADSYLNSSPESFPYYDSDIDRHSIAKSSLTIPLPQLRTISSLSTNPELKESHDYYHNYDQELGNESLAQSSCFKSAVRGFEDFSCAGESRRDYLL